MATLDPDSWPNPEGESRRRTVAVVPIIVAVIMALGGIMAAVITAKAGETKGRQTAIAELQPTINGLQTALAQPTSAPITVVVTATPAPGVTQEPAGDVGRVEGTLTDREGNPLSNISVSIRNGPEALTDVQGKFVLNEIPLGDQLIVVKSRSGGSQFTQNIRIEQATIITLVYDETTSQLGLLSITAPADLSVLQVAPDKEHKEIIYGRCDGLAQVFNGSDQYYIWVFVRAIKDDSKLWRQFPPAVIEPGVCNWQANAVMGNRDYPPYNGQPWLIVAIAASIDAGIENILNTPSLNLLPPHISSNVVNVEMRVQP